MSLLDRVPSYMLATATRIAALVAIAGLGFALPDAARAQDPCSVPDNGSGTVTLPPAGCDYLSPDEVHMIIDGLPPGTTIEFAPIHRDFICSERNQSCTMPLPPGDCEEPGGTLGGNGDCFDSSGHFELKGTGGLNYLRTIQFPLEAEVHTGPRTPGAAIQDFDTQMMTLQGQLPPGDPDFDLLRITAGQNFGLPSPGHTTLTRVGPPGSNWAVDSFFDITYRIDFVGNPAGPFSGMSGSTTATIRMAAGQNPCFAANNGTGTVTLPPQGCEYLSPTEVHQIIDGLPAGTTVELDAIHRDFICGGAGTPNAVCSVAMPPGVCEQPGGNFPGGNQDCFDSQGQIHLKGTGNLAGFDRMVSVPLATEVHTGQRTPGNPVQSFDTDMFRLFGQITNPGSGDPDFDLLRIVGGTDFGLPSPGHTTLTQHSGGTFQVDSFFDITYRIDFVGRPGGALGGMSGSTTGTIRMNAVGLPEPGLLAGLAAGVALLVGLRRWRQRE